MYCSELLTNDIVDKVLNAGAGDESHPGLGLLHSELKPVTSVAWEWEAGSLPWLGLITNLTECLWPVLQHELKCMHCTGLMS